MKDNKRFKIALSFPGERRNYVEQVAICLAELLGAPNILYDKFHEAEFARIDLDLYLQDLYRNQSELIVVFFSEDYARKDWCGLEWRTIREIILCEDVAIVMPLRFDVAEVPGFLKQDGYIWLPGQSPEETAAMIVRRYRLSEEDSVHMATCQSAFKLLSKISGKSSDPAAPENHQGDASSASNKSRSEMDQSNFEIGLSNEDCLKSFRGDRGDQSLRLVDIRVVDSERQFPRIEVKLRNRGQEVAFIKQAIIHFYDIAKLPECYEYNHQRVTDSWVYDLELPARPEEVELPISQAVSGNSVDQFSFRIGQSFGEWNWPVLAHFSIDLIYNEDSLRVEGPSIVLAVWRAATITGRTIHRTKSQELNELNSIRERFLGIQGIRGPRTVEFLTTIVTDQNNAIDVFS